MLLFDDNEFTVTSYRYFKSIVHSLLSSFRVTKVPVSHEKRSRLVYKTFILNASKTARRQRLGPPSYIYIVYMYISGKNEKSGSFSLFLSYRPAILFHERFYNTPVGFPCRGLTRSDILLRPHAPVAGDGFQGILSGKDQPLIIVSFNVIEREREHHKYRRN